jgi:hypothetical protein
MLIFGGDEIVALKARRVRVRVDAAGDRRFNFQSNPKIASLMEKDDEEDILQDILSDNTCNPLL